MKTISPETWKTVKRILHEHAAARQNRVKRTWISEPIKLGGKKTRVIINPTMRDTQTKGALDTDLNAQETLKKKTVKQVYEDVLRLHNRIIANNYLEEKQKI